MPSKLAKPALAAAIGAAAVVAALVQTSRRLRRHKGFRERAQKAADTRLLRRRRPRG